jgi:acyl-coenzyme A thioesterase PaaI-like protein
LSRAATIRRRVLRGLALNRVPGLHFPGNFLDVSFDRVARDVSRLSLAPGPWCMDSAGEVDLNAVLVLADLALGASIRANLRRHSRLGTVSVSLQFTGAPRHGRLSAQAEFKGFFRGGAGRLGMSRVSLAGARGTVCYGTGTFMALEPPRGMTLHPVPLRRRELPAPRALKKEELEDEERKVLALANEALSARGNFIENFWGGMHGKLVNGLHVGNRVGHAQGGILMGLAAATAGAALPAGWKLSGISAAFVSPGEGRILRAASKVLHQGGLTAVVRTMIAGKGGRRVLEVLTSHVNSR